MHVAAARRAVAGAVLVIALGGGGPVGCRPDDPASRVGAQRRQFSASLQGFQVLSSSPAPAMPSPAPTASPARKVGHGAAAPSATPSPSLEDAVGLVAPPAVTSDVELALVVRNGSPVSLPGLTLEVGLLAGDEERQHYRIWVDTSQIAPGATGEIRSLLREVPYVAGERFAVEVRDEVPPAERSLYREFPRS